MKKSNPNKSKKSQTKYTEMYKELIDLGFSHEAAMEQCNLQRGVEANQKSHEVQIQQPNDKEDTEKTIEDLKAENRLNTTIAYDQRLQTKQERIKDKQLDEQEEKLDNNKRLNKISRIAINLSGAILACDAITDTVFHAHTFLNTEMKGTIGGILLSSLGFRVFNAKKNKKQA